MNNRHRLKYPTAVFLFALLLPPTVICLTQLPADAQLKGSIRMEDQLKEGPSLSRDDDLGKMHPSQGETGDDLHFDAPKDMFEVETPKPAMPSPHFNLEANQDQSVNETPFAGQMMPGVPDGAAPVAMTPSMRFPLGAGFQNPLMNPTDPDESKEMQLAWDIWHRNVAQAIFIRVQTFAGRTLPRTEPLACQVAYVVTRDHRIMNVRMLVKSPNMVYNTIVFGSINAMQGSSVLEFPQGSRRMTVEKMSTFRHNGGELGFRSVVGDQEHWILRGR